MWRYEELGLGLNLENEIKAQPYVVDVLVVIKGNKRVGVIVIVYGSSCFN